MMSTRSFLKQRYLNFKSDIKFNSEMYALCELRKMELSDTEIVNLVNARNVGKPLTVKMLRNIYETLDDGHLHKVINPYVYFILCSLNHLGVTVFFYSFTKEYVTVNKRNKRLCYLISLGNNEMDILQRCKNENLLSSGGHPIDIDYLQCFIALGGNGLFQDTNFSMRLTILEWLYRIK